MLRTHAALWLGAVLLGLVSPAGPALAQGTPIPDSVGDVVVPGGLGAAAAVADDRVAIVDAYFLRELIRSVYGPEASPDVPAMPPSRIQGLVAHLDRAVEAQAPASPLHDPAPTAARPDADRLPLPLPEPVWTGIVFEGRATAATLLARILESRNTALFYYGLLSLDDGTRAWLASEPALIRDVVVTYSASFVVAAPGLRVTAGRIQPPGGDRARPAWEALVGRPTSDPAAFTRALLGHSEGRLAYFYAAMAPLSDRQLQFGLNLGGDTGERIAAARRLYRAFERLTRNWSAETSPFRRPTLDPALLLTDLTLDDRGDPVLPGGTAFWETLLDDAPERPASLSEEAARRVAEGPPVDFSWLCERMSRGGPQPYRRGHLMALAASRLGMRVTPATAADAIDALRAWLTYPTLTMSLESAGVSGVAILARAARRAAQLASISDELRSARALAQYQGALFVLTRAAHRRALSAEVVADAVSSMVAVEPDPAGEYDGRLVRWLGSFLAPHRLHEPAQPSPDVSGRAAAPDGTRLDLAPGLDDALLRLLAGAHDASPSLVDWEGIRYRVSFAAAESSRIAAWLGDDPRPYVGAALTLVEISDRVSMDRPAPDALRGHAGAVRDLLQSAGWEPDVRDRLDGVAQRLDAGRTSNLAASLRVLADDLLARGLLQYAYATALGQPSHATVSAGEVAGRHDFGPVNLRGRNAWQPPIRRADHQRGWHLTGSLLGIDVTLAHRSQVGVSSKPPPRTPTVDLRVRQALTEAVALVEPASLADADMRAIVTALGRGRQRVARLRTREEAAAVADQIRLDPERRTLLAWTVTRRPEWLATFLAPVELFWLGLDGAPPRPTLHAWGAPAGARLGCLCLHLDTPKPLGLLAGRWDSALMVSGFADLNLRLAELLLQLDMPAALLAPVLAAATLDLVNTAHQRDSDDRRGLEAFVHALRVEHVEEYLALLTSGGPLVPIDHETAAERDPRPAGVPR